MSVPLATLHAARQAMNTEFRLLLRGDDPEHLAAVAEAVFAEITRIERLLSRFDPAAEATRINRAPACSEIRVQWELIEILSDCRQWQQQAGGYFAVEWPAGEHRAHAFWFTSDSNLLRKQHPAARLDFGAFGKGYALDAAAAIVRQFGVNHALLCGGGSSWLALGQQADGGAWLVPLDAPAASDFRQLPLADRALSISATRHGDEASDIIDPATGRTIEHDAAWAVLAPAATAAEVWSTALVAMPPDIAQQYVARGLGDNVEALRLLPPA